MFLKNIKFGFYLFFMILLIIPFSLSMYDAALDIQFSEKGSVTHYYGKYHVVQVNGTVTISNPTNMTYYGLRVPFEDTVLNYKQISGENEAQYFLEGDIFVLSLVSNETISFNYVISGITNNDPITNGSVIRSLIETEEIISYHDLRVSLLKGPLENTSTVGRPDTRIVTVRIDNPTLSEVNITELTVIKTATLNITNELNKWIFPISKDGIFIGPNDGWEDDIIDTNAHDGEVYWVDYETEMYRVIFDFDSTDVVEVTVTLIQQLNRSNLTNETDGGNVFILKEISASVVQPGDVVDVTLTVLNLDGISRIVDVKDFLPDGFEFYRTDTGTVVDNLFMDSVVLGAGESSVINYSIKYIGNGQIGLDFFPGAVASVAGKNITSGKLSYIKEFLPKHKLFVQKKVMHLSDDDIRIEILMKKRTRIYC